MKLQFKPSSIKNDLTGKVFGKLRVVQYAGSTNGKSHWICQCDCGGAKIIIGSRLTNGGSTSCGCTNTSSGSGHPLWGGYGEISASVYSMIRRNAERRGVMFNVNIEHMYELFLQQRRKCALTGWDIGFATTSGSDQDVTRTASLDRINNARGYERGNIVWLHKRANMLKATFSNEEVIELAVAIAKYKGVV